MCVLTIPVKLLKCTFWFSSLGICISCKLMLMWLVEAHTLRSKDLWYGFQNLPGHEGDLKCVCRNFRFSGSPSGPLTKPSPENGPGNQYFLVSVSETSHDQAGLKALTSDSRFRSYQLTMSSLGPLFILEVLNQGWGESSGEPQNPSKGQKADWLHQNLGGWDLGSGTLKKTIIKKFIF